MAFYTNFEHNVQKLFTFSTKNRFRQTNFTSGSYLVTYVDEKNLAFKKVELTKVEISFVRQFHFPEFS